MVFFFKVLALHNKAKTVRSLNKMLGSLLSRTPLQLQREQHQWDRARRMSLHPIKELNTILLMLHPHLGRIAIAKREATLLNLLSIEEIQLQPQRQLTKIQERSLLSQTFWIIPKKLAERVTWFLRPLNINLLKNECPPLQVTIVHLSMVKTTMSLRVLQQLATCHLQTTTTTIITTTRDISRDSPRNSLSSNTKTSRSILQLHRNSTWQTTTCMRLIMHRCPQVIVKRHHRRWLGSQWYQVVLKRWSKASKIFKKCWRSLRTSCKNKTREVTLENLHRIRALKTLASLKN